MTQPASACASLDTEETTVPAGFAAQLPPEADDLRRDIAFRHSGWQADRWRVLQALTAAGASASRVLAFKYCGANAWVIRSDLDPSVHAVASDHCHDRFCRPCAAWRASVICTNIVEHLADRPFRFLTLTVKTTDLTLRQSIDKLYSSFARLRRSKLWARAVTGGCAVCEIKPRRGNTGWHPHLHCILEGRFLPQAAVRKLWLDITGDSFIVDVRRGTNAEHAAQYVAKYIAKPFGAEVIRNHDCLCDAIDALSGRRVVTTFGTWRGVQLCHYDPLGSWSKICTLADLRASARGGDFDAAALLADLTGESIEQLPAPCDPARAPPELTLWSTNQ